MKCYKFSFRKGLDSAGLYTEETNKASINLFSRLGFWDYASLEVFGEALRVS